MTLVREKTLPYMLASQGYDVWIGNNRGNRVTLGDEWEMSDDYWEYNFDHLVDYDLPAILDNVLAVTQKEKVIFIGHSQGSTQCLLGMGVHSNIMEKI